MAFSGTGKIWINGELIEWANAKIHIASHVIHYGSSVFEGIRAYETPNGTSVLRLDRHVQRMLDSCKIARLDCPYGYEELMDAIRENRILSLWAQLLPRPVTQLGGVHEADAELLPLGDGRVLALKVDSIVELVEVLR